MCCGGGGFGEAARIGLIWLFAWACLNIRRFLLRLGRVRVCLLGRTLPVVRGLGVRSSSHGWVGVVGAVVVDVLFWFYVYAAVFCLCAELISLKLVSRCCHGFAELSLRDDGALGSAVGTFSDSALR